MTSAYVRALSIDQLIRDGESVFLFEDRSVRLGQLGTCIAMFTATPQTIDCLVAKLGRAFGTPEGVDIFEATQAAVTELMVHGVLRQAND